MVIISCVKNIHRQNAQERGPKNLHFANLSDQAKYAEKKQRTNAAEYYPCCLTDQNQRRGHKASSSKMSDYPQFEERENALGRALHFLSTLQYEARSSQAHWTNQESTNIDHSTIVPSANMHLRCLLLHRTCSNSWASGQPGA